MQVEHDSGIGSLQPLGRSLELAPPDIGLRVENLALQVRTVDDVEIDQAQPPDSRRREVERSRRAQASHPDDEDAPRRQPLLAGDADLGERKMPGVAAQLLGREAVHRRDATPSRRSLAGTEATARPAAAPGTAASAATGCPGRSRVGQGGVPSRARESVRMQ